MDCECVGNCCFEKFVEKVCSLCRDESRFVWSYFVQDVFGVCRGTWFRDWFLSYFRIGVVLFDSYVLFSLSWWVSLIDLYEDWVCCLWRNWGGDGNLICGWSCLRRVRYSCLRDVLVVLCVIVGNVRLISSGKICDRVFIVKSIVWLGTAYCDRAVGDCRGLLCFADCEECCVEGSLSCMKWMTNRVLLGCEYFGLLLMGDTIWFLFIEEWFLCFDLFVYCVWVSLRIYYWFVWIVDWFRIIVCVKVICWLFAILRCV